MNDDDDDDDNEDEDDEAENEFHPPPIAKRESIFPSSYFSHHAKYLPQWWCIFG